MLSRVKAFMTGLAAKSRTGLLSAARRLGWVRLHELARELAASKKVVEELRADLEARTAANRAMAEKLAAFRETMARQKQQLSDAGLRAQALKQRAEKLVEAMRSREIAAAQNMAMVRASLARMRQGGERQTLADEEVALLAEIDRLQAIAERQGQTLHRTYDVDRVLGELRAGRMAVVPFALETLLGAPGQSTLFLARDGKAAVGLKEIAKRHVAQLRSMGGSAVGTDERFDVVVTAFDLETMSDPVVALGCAAGSARPGGKLVILGSVWHLAIPDAADLWRTPPKMLQSLLPGWTWERFVLVGPDGKVGLEIIDPALLLEFRPALGKGAPLLAPPYMSVVAIARKQSGAEH